jgi:acyl-CoA thioesterase
MTCATGTRFQRDTAVHPLEGGRFAVRLDEGSAGPYPAAARYAEQPAPQVPLPEALTPLPPDPGAASISHRVELRLALGAAPFAGDEAHTGGWARLAEPGPPDLPTVALFTDIWWPASWPRLERLSPVPTVDLTIHFRAPLPPDAGPWVLGEFRSPTARDGYVDGDARLWLPDGTLLAQARQLALLLPGG